MIDGNIQLTLCDSEKGVARIGVDAPASIKVWREEIAPPSPSPSLEDELAEALQLLLGGMRMPDNVFPTSHQMMHVRHDHVAKAEAVVAKWKGGDQ